MDLTSWQIALIIVCGSLSGFINTVSGGGSLIIVPLYLYLGIPPTLANYTNRIPIFAQSSMATVAYAVSTRKHIRRAFIYLVPILSGAFIGATLARDIDERTINRTLLGVLIFVSISLIADFIEKKEARQKRLRSMFEKRPSYWMMLPLLLVIGFYGGFIQIGVGLVIYAVMHILFREHYLTANIIKVCTICCVCILSLIVFSSHLTWPLVYVGLLTAAGSIAGSILGVRVTIGPHGEVVIRILLTIISIAGILRLIFIV